MAKTSTIAKALARLKSKSYRCEKYENYYDGKHDLAFATDKFLNAFGYLFRAFADNLCPSVVDATSDRMQVIGFSGTDEDETLANEIWKDNQMSEQAGQVHQEVGKQGNAYVFVWPDPVTGEPTFYLNRAHQVHCEYDPESPGKVLWAAKCWSDSDGYVYLTMYYPDQIEKYVTAKPCKGFFPTKDSAFVRRAIENESWPLINEWGQVPVFHFRNNAPIGREGVSDLKDVIPIQNALNKSVCDMLVGMEFTALPQRWATGLELEIDEVTGKPTANFQPSVDRLLAVANDAAKFGQFEPGRLEQFLKVQDSFRFEIARISGTPLTYIMLLQDPPSGEALKVLENRLVKKVTDREGSHGNVWAAAMTLAIRIKRGNKGMATRKTLVDTKWADPAMSSELEKAQLAIVRQSAGMSKQRSMRSLDMTDDEIQADMKVRAQEDSDKLSTNREFIKNFYTGNGTEPGPSAPSPETPKAAAKG